MGIVGWYFGAAFTLIPTWLVLRAWHSYSKLDKRSLRVLIFAVDRGRPAGWIEQKVSPITLALINVPICAGGIACSRLGRKSAGESLPLRKAIGLASGCLMLICLLALSNPH
jgi:hypothetical protein